MRVIVGTARGRRIKVPKGSRARPTPARVREAMFAILGDRVIHGRVLDLYCGSGALGIEALSRGANGVTFVDKSRSCLRTVKENLASLGFSERAHLVCRSCPEGIDASLPGPYDMILSDPPYLQQSVPELAARLLETPLLSSGAIWVHEGPTTGKDALVISDPRGWQQVDMRRYGDTGIWFFEPEFSV